MNTGTDSSAELTRFSDTESEELAEYHPVNAWAVMSAACGLFSAAALLHPILMLIPLIGVVSAFVAARQLASSAKVQTGRAAMKWGLFLCILCGVFAVSVQTYREWRIDREARRLALSWLELFRQGNVRVAHQLMLDDAQRIPAGGSLDDHYIDLPASSAPRDSRAQAPGHEGHNHGPGNSHDHQADTDPSNPYPEYDLTDTLQLEQAPPVVQLHAFKKRELIAELIKLGDRAHFRFVRTVNRSQPSVTVNVIDQEFAVEFDEGGRQQRIMAILSLQRALFNRVASWKVVSADKLKGT
jgi:hypothetical protein